VGRYEFIKELIVVRDLELVKKITVKDFEHFLDHRPLLGNSDSYFSRNLFSLRGQEWKDMRSTLSPAFTSSKMRLMVPFMVEVGDQMMRSLHKIIKESKSKLTHEDIKSNDLAAGFATVTESAVGKKKVNRVWSDEDLVAQAVLFFIAGFEAVSSGTSFLLHELAMNPDVQERLAQEIKEHDVKNGGKFDFNSIQNMVYMDMVVSGEAEKLFIFFVTGAVVTIK
ncbi:hypothetical protein HF086_012125, partial [Spodoptera exigua]